MQKEHNPIASYAGKIQTNSKIRFVTNNDITGTASRFAFGALMFASVSFVSFVFISAILA